MSSRFLRALNRENHNSPPPVWLMRQAGRYLPEYRKIREKHSFCEMCHTPEIAAEVTMLPLRRYGMDAAILFSDILVILEAFGKPFSIVEGKGPVIHEPISTAADVEALDFTSVKEKLAYVAQAISLIKEQASVPLIGFAGAPFTVASYLIEGGPSSQLSKTRKWMRKDPDSFFLLLQKMTAATAAYFNLQVEAGIDAFQLFDSWAKYLGEGSLHDYSFSCLQALLHVRKPDSVPMIYFGLGTAPYAQDIAASGVEGMGLDWQLPISFVRETLGPDITLQGNLDPYFLYAEPDCLRREVRRILKEMEGDPAFIFNLGHGILPDVPVDRVQVLVDCIREGVSARA